MFTLNRNLRPVVEFDPTNVEHRRIYAEFKQTGSWAKSPVMFAHDDQFVSIPVQLDSVMTDYYTKQER